MSYPYEVLEAFVAARGIRFGTGSTLRPEDSDSFHADGRARDFGLANSDADAISRLFNPIAMDHPELIPEVFGSDGVGTDLGQPYQAPGHTGDHTHVAIAAGVTLDQLQAAYTGGPVLPSPVTPGTPAPGSGGGSKGGGISDAGLKRFLLLVGGAGLVVWGLVLLGLDMGAVRTAVRAHPIGKMLV